MRKRLTKNEPAEDEEQLDGQRRYRFQQHWVVDNREVDDQVRDGDRERGKEPKEI